MKEYADYQFYEDIYKGSLSVDLFNSLIPKASHIIDISVNRELKEEDITDKVKFVACELVDFLKENGKDNLSGNLVSKSLDGVSKSYKTKTNNEIQQEKAEILNGLPLELIRFL